MKPLDLVYLPLAIVTAPWWAGKKREGWRSRFGEVEGLKPPRPSNGGRILLHAVSVGEVAALRYLIPVLIRSVDVVLSVTTDTGLKRARELFGSLDGCSIVRYPLDFSWAVDRFLDAVKVDVVGLVELEVWPHFVEACVQRQIPVGVINGRLSARSARGYGRIAWFFRSVLRKLAFAGVQDSDYAARFCALGLPQERCRIAGSMKWDAAKIEDVVPGADRLAAELGIDRSEPLIVAGSTGPEEEALLHKACPPGVQLLCAPRKPERFDEAAAALGEGVVRRTSRVVAPPGTRRFLLDTIGELRMAYGLATVVVVGRSFGAQFGSDPIEPVALGKPVVIGPATSDFEAIVHVLRSAGGLIQTTREELGGVLAELVADQEKCRRLAAAGREAIRGEQGASERYARMLLEALVDSKRSDALGGKEPR
jgi:3-deoxy-D-manno-octulosonic-acid transferase